VGWLLTALALEDRIVFFGLVSVSSP